MSDEDLIIATILCLTDDINDEYGGKSCFACPLKNDNGGCIPQLKKELIKRIINSLNMSGY